MRQGTVLGNMDDILFSGNCIDLVIVVLELQRQLPAHLVLPLFVITDPTI